MALEQIGTDAAAVWRPSMRRWLSSRSTIQAADLDDVAQEVFLRLLRYSDDTVVDYPQS